ncbi:hypothetical protein [Cronobacter turicensis]|uniref:hypothetical protein n=1 Tax=Cronobacter turicensis TaxID=413502 RepID=UPI0024C33BDA|nr:hypothetical protein [Cronobacter turicensis]MDK1235004.1 hypothetical protein [Cronobacter turicensis]
MEVIRLNLSSKLDVVIRKTAVLLPADVGQHLLAVITPEALATMAGIVVIWAGAHFFGIGEIADVILLMVGWVALGGVAVEAGKKLYDFALKTNNAHNEAELDEAAQDLADAITLIGVNTVLAILLKKKPADTFKTSHRGTIMPRYGKTVSARMHLPVNPDGGWRYRPKIRFTDRLPAGLGSTSPGGDITIGRMYDRTQKSSKEAAHHVLEAIYHERVHQFIAAKFFFLREFRTFMRHSAYTKSYLLRYLEEALAETVAKLRANGVSSRYIIESLKFPLTNHYQITYAALWHETAGILLGPVVVGGVMYNVYYGMQK